MRKLLLPLVVWSFAVGLVFGAAKALNHSQDQAELARAMAELQKQGVQWANLSAADYQVIQKKVLVSGGVTLLPSDNGLRVRAKDLSDYATWRLTLNQVLFDVPNVVWQIEYLCSGKCPSGEAHLAVLTGKRAQY